MATTEFFHQLMSHPDRLNDLVDEAKQMALEKGILMRTLEAPNSSEVGTTTHICRKCFCL